MWNLKRTSLAVFTAIALATALTCAAAPPAPRVIDIGPSVRPFALNNAGQVVGTMRIGVDDCAPFSWTLQGGMVRLGVLGTLESLRSVICQDDEDIALAVNERGDAVGISEDDDGFIYAVLWTQEGMTKLGALPGGLGSIARRINNRGQVAGSSWVAGFDALHAFVWSRETGMVDLGDLGGGNIDVVALSDSGQLVANRQYPGPAFSGTLQGGLVELRGLAGSITQAAAVNNHGAVVGFSSTADDAATHAVLWTPEGEVIDLGTLGAGDSSFATGINDRGEVIGYDVQAGNRHAFLWTRAGGMVDLGPTGGTSTEAVAINNNGEVLVMSRTINNHARLSGVFVWTQRDGMIELPGLGDHRDAPLAINERGDVIGISQLGRESHGVLWQTRGN